MMAEEEAEVRLPQAMINEMLEAVEMAAASQAEHEERT